MIAHNPEQVSSVMCDKFRDCRQFLATSRGHVRQKMRQKQVLLIPMFNELKMVSRAAMCSVFFDSLPDTELLLQNNT